MLRRKEYFSFFLRNSSAFVVEIRVEVRYAYHVHKASKRGLKHFHHCRASRGRVD
jgi:hypothetical protein